MIRDPRHAQLRQLLNELRSVQPDSEWVKEQRESLLRSIGQKTVVPFSIGDRIQHIFQALVPASARSFVRGPVAAVLSGITILIGGSMASVSAAERAIPGDLLFPVKLASEQTRLALTNDRTERVRLKGEFVNRRVDEIKQIAQTNVEKKPERIKEATEILRRDLDTVKNQLAESAQGTPTDRAKVAKIVDQTGTDVVDGLAEARLSLPVNADIRSQVAEVEASATSASFKAVKVIIDSQNQDPSTVMVVSKEELLHSINQKVEGVSEHVSSATQQLTDAGILSATSTMALSASSTLATASSSILQIKPEITSSTSIATASSSLADLVSANASLAAARVLVLQDRLGEVGDKLIEASKSAASVERKVDELIQTAIANASSSAALAASASTTTPMVSSSSSTNVQVSSTPATTTSSAAGTEPK